MFFVDTNAKATAILIDGRTVCMYLSMVMGAAMTPKIGRTNYNGQAVSKSTISDG